MKNYLKRSDGFSLTEVIVAIFLLGIVILVIASLPQTINLISLSQTESEVREVAAKKLSDVRLTGYDNLPIGTTNFSDSRLNGLSGLSAVMEVVDCPLTICPEGNAVKLKQVTITIDWNENNAAKHFQLDTLVGQGGLK